MRVLGGAFRACLSACPLVAGGRAFGLVRSSWGVFRPFVPAFCPLSLCLFGVVCKYALIWRFKGVFSAVWGCCVGLCCLGALRGLWGFCVRERLGGFMSCGVFAPVFILLSSAFLLLCLCFSSLPIFWGFAFVVLGLSSFLPFLSCLLLCPLWLLLFLFPLRMYTDKKKGRKGFAPCVLSCPVMCV